MKPWELGFVEKTPVCPYPPQQAHRHHGGMEGHQSYLTISQPILFLEQTSPRTEANILCLGNPMDRGSLAGYRPWDHKEPDVNDQLNTHAH